MIANAVEVEATLQPDGRLILDKKPDIPPGRVRVSLQLLAPSPTNANRLPDAPWCDDSIPAPFDLPRAGSFVPIQPRAVAERLPEIVMEMQENAE